MIWASLLCAVLAADDPVVAQPATADQLRFFETSIRPLMVEHCTRCHGDRKQWAGLRPRSLLHPARSSCAKMATFGLHHRVKPYG